MKYFEFTFIDSNTKQSVATQPAYNGPIYPEVPGLEFLFDLKSKYPLDSNQYPLFYGYTNQNIDVTIYSGVIRELTEQEVLEIKSIELAARKAIKQSQRKQAWEHALKSGFEFQNVTFKSDELSRQLISECAQTAIASKVTGLTFSPITWYGKDSSGNETYLNLTIDEMIDFHRTMVTHGESLFSKNLTFENQINSVTIDTMNELDSINLLF